jgi:Tfp pilus assembly protein PilE
MPPASHTDITFPTINRRKGVTILEVTVAALLLGTLMMVCLHLLSATSAQRRALDQRQAAIIELSNEMERLTALPWTELTRLKPADERISPWAQAILPEAKLTVELAAPAGDPAARRITASLRWQDHNGRFLPPVTLTAWKYKRLD